jgi:hypothetical protein
MTEVMKGLRQRVEDATLRIDSFLPVSLAINGGRAGDWVEDLVMQMESGDDPIYTALPCLKVFADGDDFPEEYEVAEVLEDANLTGFLAQVCHPHMTFFPNGAKSYSWGNYNFIWLYGESLEDIVAQAEAWAAKLDEENKARAVERRAVKS